MKSKKETDRSVQSRQFSAWLPDIILAVILIVLTVIMVYPFIYEIFMSLSDPVQIVKHRGLLAKPIGFTTIAYQVVFSTPQIWTGFANTLFIMVVGLAINLVLTSFGAYFLCQHDVMFYKPIMMFILITMYFSGGLVPFYLTVRNMGLYDNIWAVILPAAVSTYNLILLRSYFSTIPKSLQESVMIDGGGHFTILFKIYVPLCKPAMMVMVLYYAVGHWNSWFNAFIFLKDNTKFPLQLVLRNMLKDDSQVLLKAVQSYAGYDTLKETVKAAMIIVSTVPFLCIYPFLQKHFESGMMIGSLKE